MTGTGRLRVALIVGSTRAGRFGPTVADWFAGRLRRRDLDLDRIDLADAGLPDQLTGRDEPAPAAVRDLGDRLAAADAFIVVTPEYNRSFPAAVKNAIDWFDTEWAAKPVTVVGYGSDTDGGHAATQLRQIFGELNAVPIRRTITITKTWQRFAADGTWPRRDPELDEAVNTLLDQLLWWATALRTARTTTPFVR
ncbi:NADPH-dependent FMN reductase [Nocardia sp. XZ_19_369]|uniref:NADPH-dependent FMN reductase n=1 Tax=Nocardia sp. XZ_19_369 TaxID=2769487 RepID=UPI00188F2E6E|nr:NAD(P)H-dependent oxidoreductase [Nocardia sp. XZ_19_369]